MSRARAPVVLLRGLGFAESLRWREGELWFSDFRTRNVVSVDPSGRATRRAFLPAGPSGLGWTPDGRLLVASMIDRQIVEVDGLGRRRSVASLADIAVGPLNDMLVDATGTVYVGDHGGDVVYREITPETALDILRPAPLLMVTPTGEVSQVTRPIGLANGMATHSDGRLIVTESLAGCLRVFGVGTDGSVRDETTFADLGTGIDAITIDAEDAVWACLPLDGKIVRLEEGGTLLDEIAVPNGHPVACALGGPDGRTLYASITYGDLDAWGSGEVESGIESWQVDIPAPSG